jgi:methionyl-tRNA formyltransferase
VSPSILFFGTPSFAAEILETLIEAKIPLLGVVTQPDRPKGRSLQITPSPVKEIASKRLPGIPILQPEKCSDPDFLDLVRKLGAALHVVVAFGQILPQKLLDIPPLGSINVHASLLPKYRGAAPIHRCLMNGDVETGVSIQKMVKQLDAGDVIAESRMEIGPNTTFGELEQTLCDLSKPLLIRVVHSYRKGIPPALPQDPNGITYAAKVEPEEGEIDWTQPAPSIHNLIRAFSPRPGAWTWVQIGSEKKRLKIFRTTLHSGSAVPTQGLSTKELILACGSGALQIQELQMEGKPRMNAADWLRGLKISPRFN